MLTDDECYNMYDENRKTKTTRDSCGRVHRQTTVTRGRLVRTGIVYQAALGHMGAHGIYVTRGTFAAAPPHRRSRAALPFGASRVQ